LQARELSRIHPLIMMLIGIILCYLAFTVVRALAWTMIYNVGGISVLLAALVAVLWWRREK
jgi:hypothetical protein